MAILNIKHKHRFIYFKVRDSSWKFLLDNNVRFYPLDLKNIIKQNGWKTITFSEYFKLNPYMEYLKRKYKDGFTIYENKSYLIIYNEQKPLHRQRFTIAHEIGHIVLHLKVDHKLLEKEANMFAARILMPMLLIQGLKITKPEELAKLCKVSLQAASYRLKRYDLIKTRNKFYSNKYEIKLLTKLQPFIQEKKWQQ